ncbi:chemotaxis protein CheB [Luteimonas sp. WGS1318]|uniref:chemotaxis protein CheB n=1 Tax=Luteimonas sp. WGS1318 TaxID=3366815 RepID=UPI00372D409D
MTEPAIRTVVIARAGAACDRLVEGLVESGADVVQAVDPTQAGPDAIEALAPDAIVVALDPVVEDALETFEPLLLAPGRTVIFEEAALVLERTGWDAARWVRHLAAKLRGQGSVLPPGAEQDDDADAAENVADRGADVASPVSDAFDPVSAEFDGISIGDTDDTEQPALRSSDDAIEGFTIEGLEDDGVTADGLTLQAEDAPATSDDAPRAYAFDPVSAEFDGIAEAPTDIAPLVLSLGDTDDVAQPVSDTRDDAIEGFTIEGLEDDFASASGLALQAEDAPVPAADASRAYAFDPVSAEFDGLQSEGDAAPLQAPVLDFDFELGDTDDLTYVPPVADTAAPAGLDTLLTLEDAPEHGDSDTQERGPDRDDALEVDAPSSAIDVTIGELDGSTLQLLDGDALPAAAPDAAPPRHATLDLAALESRISGLSLADTDSYGHGPRRGVVLVEGGLGGPDAVRQLLGAIPEGFPRPILVRLQLDGGRYDRLVRQMERATSLTVQLAEAGMSVVPGEVYFLPPGLLPAMAGGDLRFAETGDLAALPEAVPAEDSAVLFLSGADVSLVEIAMGPTWQGALVGGQSDEGCYDSVAAHAVAERGGPSGRPDEIADWLLARWMPAARQSEPGPGGLSL